MKDTDIEMRDATKFETLLHETMHTVVEDSFIASNEQHESLDMLMIAMADFLQKNGWAYPERKIIASL